MGLAEYRAKRDFRVTPEPRGGKRPRGSGAPSFVVQQHAASHLHYDFRLEWDGALWSWAVPKGPSLDPADKRLAIEVEDHPLEYGGFEGIIPQRQYGGGTVLLWDRGTWTPEGDPAAGRAAGRLAFTLEGEKLHGAFVLVRTRSRAYGGKTGDKAWLLIKVKDRDARVSARPIVETAPESVASGRLLRQVARARERVWEPRLSVVANVRAGAVDAPKAPTSGAPAVGARKARCPALIAPALATLVASPPDGDDWLHEVKYDGYRMVCRIARGSARLYSRSGKEWTAAFPAVARELAALPVRTAWLDGEVAVTDAKGRTDFQALQNAIASPASAPAVYFVFDLMHVDGYDLRGAVLTERKRLLRAIVGAGTDRVRTGPEVQGAGGDLFRQACGIGLEGIVSKRADSHYRDGTRSRDWVKVKCVMRQEMVVGGYTEPRGSRHGFGALLLGHYDNGALRYAGKVGTGFDERTIGTLLPLLEARRRASPPFADPPRGAEARGVHWTTPELVAEVAFTEWSSDGALRHPSFQGLRPDRKAAEVVREVPMAAAAAAGRTPRRKRAAASAARAAAVSSAASVASSRAGAARVAGVAISHPDKLYFPEAGITKLQLAQYYEAVAPALLPHLANRPLSLVRCPDGWPQQCFYQKHADPAVHAAVSRIEVPEGKGTASYLGAGSAKALAGLVQWGVIELHPWGSRRPRLDRPDRLVFDFDPDDAVAWDDLVAGIGVMRTLLDELGLMGFLKTTGGKGLHVVVPLRPTLTWSDAKAFSQGVAKFMERTFPDRFTATAAKAHRRGRIYIDWLRNAEGATAVAPYAVRARSNAPVATPVDWAELAQDVRHDHFNVRNVPDRLARAKADPWAAFATTRQTITAAMRRRFA